MKFHNYIPLMVWGGAVFVKKMIDSDGIKFHNYIFLMVWGGGHISCSKRVVWCFEGGAVITQNYLRLRVESFFPSEYGFILSAKFQIPQTLQTILIIILPQSFDYVISASLPESVFSECSLFVNLSKSERCSEWIYMLKESIISHYKIEGQFCGQILNVC